ncbi:regulator of microtubule dynamics protein 2-like isoform X2 [Pseudomyrmex gracilis]|uniref:regulator of microtubule dynamics protein 2-like isoform X2 n=1 Tax=Pseudomyrmex gracilis TaxID=219809 RepID=UPI00099566A6|nr:regulator of microtubule dynamics protein 2-like isoform X2 [Pseudomyrmex gracilis]
MSQDLRTQLITAAVAATIGVISAAGIFIYQTFLERQRLRKNPNVSFHLDKVEQRLMEVREELHELRLQQDKKNQQDKKDQQRKNKRDNDSTHIATDNDTDVFSIASTDVAEDEFVDCSESGNSMSDVENRDCMGQTAEDTCSGLDLSIFDIHYQQREFAEEDYIALNNLADTYPDNVDVIWRYARSCYKYLNCITDLNAKKATIGAGIKCCEKLLPELNADLHKWCAILVGVYGEYLPIAEKINNGYRFKKLVTKALEIRPSDADLHHLLGRFNYEVAATFSELPSASFEDAIESFQKADTFSNKLNPENHLFLSKCYIATNNYKSACSYLKQICELSVTNEEEKRIQNDARQLFDKYSKYCQ